MKHSAVRKQRVRLRTAFLVFGLFAGALAVAQNSANGSGADLASGIHATHVLGFAGMPDNTAGSLTIKDQSLRFESQKKTVALVGISSIEDIFLSRQDKQVGGTPMTVGKVAAPFGGGRVVSLFSHKKYDDITLIYRDKDGGLHNAIFQIQQGEGATLKQELIEAGAHVSVVDNSNLPPSAESKNATN